MCPALPRKVAHGGFKAAHVLPQMISDVHANFELNWPRHVAAYFEGEELLCQVLDCIKRDACNTGVAFYSHASPFYQAYRGQCLCYSGSFVCSKPPK
ncbi:Uncharacterized protein FKW44_022161, partial [Caligus rogercresseyi]